MFLTRPLNHSHATPQIFNGRTTKSQTDAATSKTKQTNKPVHLTNVQTNRRRKEQDQKMPRKSARKINPDGVADPLATQDEDQAALDAGEVSG